MNKQPGKERTPSEIINESGNRFHCQVATTLRDKGWTVLLSPFYVDSATDKAREIDLICEKVWPLPSLGSSVEVHLQLYIECKYITQNVVFWFDGLNRFRAKEWLAQHTPLKPDNAFSDRHHYVENVKQVAKLFSSGGDRNAENDPIYRAVTQCLGGLIHNRRMQHLVSRGAERMFTIPYPVILWSGGERFYRTEVQDSNSIQKVEANFLLEVDYAYLGLNGQAVREYFLIDVINFAQLDVFLSALNRDVVDAMRPLLVR